MTARARKLSVFDSCECLSCGDDCIDRFHLRDGDVVGVAATSWQVAGEFVGRAGDDLSDHEGIHVNFSWYTLCWVHGLTLAASCPGVAPLKPLPS